MRPALLYVDAVRPLRRRLFSDPKMHDVEWLFRVKFCFRAGLAGLHRASLENK